MTVFERMEDQDKDTRLLDRPSEVDFELKYLKYKVNSSSSKHFSGVSVLFVMFAKFIYL